MLVVGWTDTHGNITGIGANVSDLLGYKPSQLVGTSALAALHPADLERVVLSAEQARHARAGVMAKAQARHADGAWCPLFLLIFPPHEEEADGVGFAIGPASESLAPARLGRLYELEHRIWRIGLEVQASRVLGPPDQPPLPPEATRIELSPRQWAILNRLSQGQRVPTIARDLNVAQSTVRNHLTAIFRKFGVTSQEELLAKLNAGR